MRLAEVPPSPAARVGYSVEYASGKREIHGPGPPAFTISAADESQFERILKGNAYRAALGFIRGKFRISGDLIAALRLRQTYSHRSLVEGLYAVAARLAPARIETWFQSRKRAAANIRFHYDVSNEFYETFLDSRMVYSAALFRDASWPLDRAQEAKLEEICEDLELQPGERFLDVGCGWGGVLLHAAERYHVHACGCTLSHSQYEYTKSLIHARGLEECAAVEEMDYRDVSRHFDKISSIGMFEHVGRHRLDGYFRKIYSSLDKGGLFLNSGIVRPQSVGSGVQTWFLLRRVFPGGELAHLSDVVRAAEGAGFVIRKIQSLRADYARTCQEWVARLRRNRDLAVGLVGEETYRTWMLYLAASALNFESGQTDVFSIVMGKV